MKLRKKIALTTVAAGMVLSTISGIPLSSKGLQEALGVPTAYAASDIQVKDALAILKTKLTEINGQFGINSDYAIKGADTLPTVKEKINSLTTETVAPVAKYYEKANITDAEALKMLQSIALIAFGNVASLDNLKEDNQAAIDKLRVYAKLETVSKDDVINFAKEVQKSTNVKKILGFIEIKEFDLAKDEIVNTLVAVINNQASTNPFATSLKNLNINVEDLNDVFTNVVSHVGSENLQQSIIAMAIATARNELTTAPITTADKTLKLVVKENNEWSSQINALIADYADVLIWEVNGTKVSDGKIPSTATGTVKVIAKIGVSKQLKDQAIYIGNVTVPSSETGGPGGIGSGSSTGGGAVVIDNVLPKFDDILASFKTSKDALNVKFAAALAKLSTLNVSSLIVVENGKSVVSISDEKAAAYIKSIKEAYDKLVKQAKELDPNFNAPALSITLDLGTTKTATADVKLSKKLLELASEAQVSHIRVLVNGVVFSLPVAEFKGNVVVSITKENDSVATNVTKLPLASGVYSFSITVDGKAVEQFSNKVELQIPLLNATGSNEFLTIAKIVDGKLQILGGKVQANSFKKSRNSLSSYVVVENKVSFNDVESVQAWAGKQIQVAAAKGIIEGKGEGNFDPRAKVTRAEFAKMLVKALEIESTTAKNEFSDVADTSWAAEYVAAASSLGIINGVGNGKFDPNAEITRAQMAAMISRALKLTKTTEADDSVLNTFTDADAIPASLKSDISVAVNEGLIIGSNGKFNPNGSATRAEAAVVIYRVVK